ncbi:MAG: hypothetical protein AB7S56_06870 [Halothiobacillaceae bacterium]
MNTSTMRAYVQTRGKNTDYQFLGASPPDAWWQDFRDASSFEQPTLIVKGDTHTWHAYLSGIASARTDRVGTTIRYTLVIEGTCSASLEDDSALHLIRAWLEEAVAKNAGQSQQGRLGKALDRVFDESRVEASLASSDVAGFLLSELELDSGHSAQSGWSGSWVSAMNHASARSAFEYRIAEILAGKEKGFAAWLNLLGTTEDVNKLAQKFEGHCAVLIDTPADDFEDDGYAKIKTPPPKPPAPELPNPSKTPSPSPDDAPVPHQMKSHAANTHKLDGLRKPFVVAALLIITVIAVIVLSNSKPNPTPDQPNPVPTTTQR